MTLGRRPELSPALGIGAFVEKTLVHAGQCTKVDPEAKPDGRGPARLRRDGGPRRGDQHRRGRARRLDRGHRLRRRRRRARSPVRGWPGRRRSSRSTPTTRSWSGPRSSAPPTRSTPKQRDVVEAMQELTDGNGAERRHRRGRPARDLQAGLLRPRPRRHRGAGRRADAGHDAGAAADRRLRPRRRAEVVLVRRLPAQPRLPDAHRPVPAGPAAAGQVRVRDDSRWTASRTRSRRCTAARCCARSWCF